MRSGPSCAVREFLAASCPHRFERNMLTDPFLDSPPHSDQHLHHPLRGHPRLSSQLSPDRERTFRSTPPIPAFCLTLYPTVPIYPLSGRRSRCRVLPRSANSGDAFLFRAPPSETASAAFLPCFDAFAPKRGKCHLSPPELAVREAVARLEPDVCKRSEPPPWRLYSRCARTPSQSVADRPPL